ncbi:hypothetical protein B7R78_0011850 [Ralstonia solanacearum]|uniref:Uncharacterized protein n=1 Tax=Ralstonia solanacearum K60 TaxID=1091042 RepID=A0AAP8D366_RALSL|nr:hypothetical protein [Ralstonia solanacearum]MBT1537791.1 hypothetical protein [Ralstonia solanacearum]OYQ12231.1 hypothetical protein B7R77_02455 [Ralstonia solanacearum K60]RIJ87978.1 hypothetical protein RSP822_02170 [Ralstonia solanacearum]CCF96402.1 hypothetical protein RSK60_1460009 [Ralstonia solanacearum K60]
MTKRSACRSPRRCTASDAGTPTRIDSWQRNPGTSLRAGDSRTIDPDARGTLTTRRLDVP